MRKAWYEEIDNRTDGMSSESAAGSGSEEDHCARVIKSSVGGVYFGEARIDAVLLALTVLRQHMDSFADSIHVELFRLK